MKPDLDPEQEEQMRQSLGAEMIRPAGTFQGKELWPFTKAARAVFQKLTTNDDTVHFCALAFVFILAKRTAPTFKADVTANILIPFWDNRAGFVAEIITLFDAVTPEDMDAATRLMDECLKMGIYSQVQALPRESSVKGKKTQKKTQSGRRMKRGTASRSRKR